MDYRNMSFLHFLTVMDRTNASNPSRVYHSARLYLAEFHGNYVGDLRPLLDNHYAFIYTGLSDIRDKLREVNINPSDLTALLATYDLLFKCLIQLIPVLGEQTMLLYDHWVSYIHFLISFGDYKSAKDAIQGFLGMLNNNSTRCIVPAYRTYTHHDKCEPLILLDILEGYICCLSQTDLGVDFCGIVDVVEGIDEWFKVFDGDLERRKWLVEYLIQEIQFDNEEASAKLFGLVLVEQAKMEKDASLVQLGVELVLKKKSPFLIEVLKHLAYKFKVELEDDYPPSTNELCIKQLQLLEHRGYLSSKICISMESILSYRILEVLLHDESPLIHSAMNLIANARENGDSRYLPNLNRAIDILRLIDSNKIDQGASLFIRGQALCLRALCHYQPDSSPQAFIQDISDALKMWNESDLIEKDSRLLHYTNKLLLYAFDVLITADNEDTHKILENILIFFEKSDRKVVGILWQFKSHQYSHFGSEMIQNQFQRVMIDQCFVENYGDLGEEGESNKLERMVSHIREKVGWSLKSACLLGHLCYDLGERFLAMGSMTKALQYARVGHQVRYRLIKENSVLPPENQSGEVHPLLMNHIVAARVWSLLYEDFILPPCSNFICCLMSMHQEATILELMGNEIEALKVLEHGETLSIQQSASFFTGRFQAAIAKIYRKSQDFNEAEKNLGEARLQCNHISCRKCQLLLDVEIGKETVKLMRKKVSHSQNTQDIEYDLVSAKRKLQQESIKSKGSKDWKRSCEFSLLSVLTEIGKDYVFRDSTREAQTVFLEIINLVVSLSSRHPLQSQTKIYTFDDFFDIIERTEIKLSCGTHIANIIYMISWVAYKKSRDTRKNHGDFFTIPIGKIICSLKVALVLSSEVPQVFEKVAQLLAIIYFVSNKEIMMSPEVTNLEWACFFQQLTVGSDLNESFSHKLREVYGDSDPDNTLHRLTRSTDADLTQFVINFFKDLPTHTIVAINIIGKKYRDLLKTLLGSCVPSDSVALLIITRFNSRRQPLIGIFSVGSIPEHREPWGGPWGTETIVDNIAPEFKRIIKDYHISKDRTVLNTLDRRIGTFLSRMESWFGCHKYILLGEPVGSPMNSKLDYFSGFVGIGLDDTSLPLATYGGKRKPVILVLGKNNQMLPWEQTEGSKNHAYYRMPSVSSTFYTYYICDKTGRSVERDSGVYAITKPFDAYYVISPIKDEREDQCQDELSLATYLREELNLDGRLWKHVGRVIVKSLKTHSFFMYAGHGHGIQYIPGGRAALRELNTCASASLMGCSSALVEVRGSYTPIGAPIDYLLAGSPVVIGNLYNIYATWAGFLYHRLLRECEHKLSVADESDLGPCLVRAKNSTDKLLMSCGTVMYGVPTVIQNRTE